MEKGPNRVDYDDIANFLEKLLSGQYRDKGLTILELIDAGTEGLRKAAIKYDLKTDFKFLTYSVWWMRQAMVQAINEKE